MARTRARSLPPLLAAALIVLAIIVVVSIPLRISLDRSKRARTAPPSGTAVSVFVTNQLAGYREPCG